MRSIRRRFSASAKCARSYGTIPTRLNKFATILCLICRSILLGADKDGPVLTSISHARSFESNMMSNPNTSKHVRRCCTSILNLVFIGPSTAIIVFVTIALICDQTLP